MQLIFWRHADAEDGIPDLERKLTTRGQKQAAAVGAWLAPRLPEHCRILVSPAKRARQTAAALCRPDLHIEPRIAPGASVAAVLEAAAVQAWEPQGRDQAVLLVGHQPWIGQSVAQLLSGRPDYWSVRKAGVWWLARQEADHWMIKTVIDRDLV